MKILATPARQANPPAFVLPALLIALPKNIPIRGPPQYLSPAAALGAQTSASPELIGEIDGQGKGQDGTFQDIS
jgi:hypothetical protein